MRWSRLAAEGSADEAHEAPVPMPAFPCLTLPGLDNSAPDHWQSRWEAALPDCRRVELGNWSDPHPLAWGERVGEAVRRHPAGVLLVAHSLGCHAVLWWAMAAVPRELAHVRGALLVAPPDVVGSRDVRLRRFALPHAVPLPFPTTVVASDDDPYASPTWTRVWARRQGARLAEIGRAGHINAASDLGEWRRGQRLLAGLT